MSNEQQSYLDEQKKKIILEWLDKKWPTFKRVCEICNASTWSLSEDLIAPTPFLGGSIVLGGRSYPQVMIICTSCGNTKYFNAVTIGIMPGEKHGK
jgi:hypothetical protein